MTGGQGEGGGTRIAAWWAWLRGGWRDADGKRLARPFVRRYGRYVSLQFSRSQTQSRMLADDPDALLIDYTRTMLAALLLRPDPDCIGMIGLGGGSQVKFCHRHLQRARIEVVENNPGVIALRRSFGIPDDDARLQVHLDDGAAFVRARRGAFDLLLVDGYDERGIPGMLSTQAFYDDCHAALVSGGAMAVNLFSTNAALHLERIRHSFEGRVAVLEEPKMSNLVAIAWVGERASGSALRAHAGAVLHGLPESARDQVAPGMERLVQVLGESASVSR